MNYLGWTTTAYSCQFFIHPSFKWLVQILYLKEWISPFAFYPRPNSFNGIKIWRTWRKKQCSNAFRFYKILNFKGYVSCMIIHDNYFIRKINFIVKLFEKVFNIYFVCCFDQLKIHLVHLQADSTNDCNTFSSISGFLNNHG